MTVPTAAPTKTTKSEIARSIRIAFMTSWSTSRHPSPGTPYSVVPNGWSKEGGSGAWLTHSGCVIENNGGTTESGYWTPTRPGATSTIIASPTKRRKITRPATAVRFAKKTLAESFHSSKRPFSSLMVSMHSLVPDSRVQNAIQDVKDQRREDENNPKNEGRSHDDGDV